MKQGKTRVGRPTSFWDKQTKAYNQRVWLYIAALEKNLGV